MKPWRERMPQPVPAPCPQRDGAQDSSSQPSATRPSLGDMIFPGVIRLASLMLLIGLAWER